MSDFLFYGCFSTQTLSFYDFSRWQIFFSHSVQHVCAACIYTQQLLFSLATSLIVQASNLLSTHSTDSPNALLFFSWGFAECAYRAEKSDRILSPPSVAAIHNIKFSKSSYLSIFILIHTHTPPLNRESLVNLWRLYITCFSPSQFHR